LCFQGDVLLCTVSSDAVWNVVKLTAENIAQDTFELDQTNVKVTKHSFACSEFIIPYGNDSTIFVDMSDTIGDDTYSKKIIKFINIRRRKIIWNMGTSGKHLINGVYSVTISDSPVDGFQIFYLMYEKSGSYDNWLTINPEKI
jgi:hypothetical protein